MTKHEVFEELEAFDPKWQEHYKTLEAAAQAAKCVGLLNDYFDTPAGQSYLGNVKSVRDFLGEIEAFRKAEEEAAASLPFGRHNLGSVRGGNW